MTMANEQNRTQPHELRLDDRSRLSVSGVSEIESFDDSTVVLHTARGVLVIRGGELRLKTLTLQQWVFRKGFPAMLLDPEHSEEALGVALMAAQHGAPTGCSSEMGPVFAALACRLLK